MLLNLILTLWIPIALATDAGISVRELVDRCSGPEKATRLEVVPGAPSQQETLDALNLRKDFVAIGYTVIPWKNAFGAAVELYRKGSLEQRYVVVALLNKVRGRVAVIARTPVPLDIGFRHHILGFIKNPVELAGGERAVGLEVCRAWMGEPEHYYREFAILFWRGKSRRLSPVLTTLITESMPFSGKGDRVGLREATLKSKPGIHPGGLELIKTARAPDATRVESRFVWRRDHFSLVGVDVLSETIPEGP